MLAFSPDGRYLATAEDHPAPLVWDVQTLVKGKLPSLASPTGSTPRRLRDDLASADAARAYRAVWGLAATPAETVKLLGEKLTPIRVAPEQRRRVAELIAGLHSDDFRARNQAAEELGRLGELAAADLRQALKAKPPLEAQRRLELLLQRLREDPVPAPKRQAVRAIEALEQIGSPEAVRVLRRLAEGEPGAVETRQARASLDRLDRRKNVNSIPGNRVQYP
jgi:HEAT repeat protein